MSVNPVNSTSSSSNAAYDATSKTSKTLGSQDFLKLLAVQLQNQDPLDPMDDTEFISQMANFSSLESMNDLNSSFNSFSAEQYAMSAQNYLGKEVSLTDEDAKSVVHGTVDKVNIDSDGNVTVEVNDSEYDISNIRIVQLASTNPTEGE